MSMTCGFKSHLPHQKKERRNVRSCALLLWDYALHFISRKSVQKPQTGLTVLPGADIINIEKALRQAVGPLGVMLKA